MGSKDIVNYFKKLVYRREKNEKELEGEGD